MPDTGCRMPDARDVRCLASDIGLFDYLTKVDEVTSVKIHRFEK